MEGTGYGVVGTATGGCAGSPEASPLEPSIYVLRFSPYSPIRRACVASCFDRRLFFAALRGWRGSGPGRGGRAAFSRYRDELDDCIAYRDVTQRAALARFPGVEPVTGNAVRHSACGRGHAGQIIEKCGHPACPAVGGAARDMAGVSAGTSGDAGPFVARRS